MIVGIETKNVNDLMSDVIAELRTLAINTD